MTRANERRAINVHDDNDNADNHNDDDDDDNDYGYDVPGMCANNMLVLYVVDFMRFTSLGSVSNTEIDE